MPHTHIGSIASERLESRRTMVRHWLKVATAIWSKVGDGKVGIILLDRYWSGNDPWVTIDYVTAALQGHYSDDTVRRRLTELVNNGAVLERREGRQKVFALRPTFAEELTQEMENEDRTATCGQKAVDFRNLRENLVVIGPYTLP